MGFAPLRIVFASGQSWKSAILPVAFAGLIAQKCTMKIEAFIIHLKRATARQAQVAAMQQALPFPVHVLEAVDWRDLSDSQIAACTGTGLAAPRFPFRLHKPEIACFLSHRKAWQEIGARGLDAALILEDDLGIDAQVLAGACTFALGHFTRDDFVRFPERLREKHIRQVASGNGYCLFRAQPVGLGMLAQLVGADCAGRLLDHSTVFDRPVDGFLQMVWQHGVDALTVFPTGIAEISQDLGGSLIGKRKSLLEWAWSEVARPIYRKQVADLARKAAQTPR